MARRAARSRFVDPGTSVYAFSSRVLVCCPRCGKRAEVSPPTSEHNRPAARSPRLVCAHCGLVRTRKTAICDGRTHHGIEPCFRAPLFLSTSCGKHELWAYNGEHVAFLRSYVAAESRERRKHPQYGWANSSLASRLPRWMVLAKNRQTVLDGLDRLARLADRSE